MGSWGLKVDQNDSYADVYDFFFDTYNDGASPKSASDSTIETFSEHFEDYEDSNNAWFALAYAQWETKCLQFDVLEKVRSIISKGTDIKLWKELGANEVDLKKREIYLQKFLKTITTPKATKKRRKKKKIDFKLVKLIELAAPDEKKVFTVSEEYSNDVYIHTSAMMMWRSGGGSVFYYNKQGAKVDARWLDSNNIEIIVEGDINFSKKDDSAFFSGDKVNIAYK